MLYRIEHAMGNVPFRRALYLGVILVLLASTALLGCQPSAEATLPPATTIAPSPPAPATAMAESQATATQLNATPTATVAAGSTATATTEIQETAVNAEPFQVTILHTNDVCGEVDPCG